MSKSIEARTKQNVLSNSLRHRSCEHVFGVATSRNEKRAERNRERTIRTRRRTAKLLRICVPQDRHRDRIVQDERLRIIELMRCST